jgi:hypothetical protein
LARFLKELQYTWLSTSTMPLKGFKMQAATPVTEMRPKTNSYSSRPSLQPRRNSPDGYRENQPVVTVSFIEEKVENFDDEAKAMIDDLEGGAENILSQFNIQWHSARNRLISICQNLQLIENQLKSIVKAENASTPITKQYSINQIESAIREIEFLRWRADLLLSRYRYKAADLLKRMSDACMETRSLLEA